MRNLKRQAYDTAQISHELIVHPQTPTDYLHQKSTPPTPEGEEKVKRN
jgi:hypothetical protein